MVNVIRTARYSDSLTIGAELAHSLLERLAGAACWTDPRAFYHEPSRYGEADTPTRPGDNRDPTGETPAMRIRFQV